MMSLNTFIAATEEYNTFEKHVPAPYFRKVLNFSECVHAKLQIAVCGFYELYINGDKITKGRLAPYISNTNDIVYYDDYDVMFNIQTLAKSCIRRKNGYVSKSSSARDELDRALIRQFDLLPTARKMVLEEMASGQ